MPEQSISVDSYPTFINNETVQQALGQTFSQLQNCSVERNLDEVAYVFFTKRFQKINNNLKKKVYNQLKRQPLQ